jgi:hypothetical protein
MLNLESNTDQFSVDGVPMLSFIVELIVEQLVTWILAVAIGVIL